MTVGISLIYTKVYFDNMVLQLNHIIGTFFIVLCWLFCFFLPKLFKYCLITTLTIGLFNLLSYIPWEVDFYSETTFNGNSRATLSIKLNLISMILLLFVLYPDRNKLIDLIPSIKANSSDLEKDEKEKLKKIENWKIKFRNLNEDELSQKINDKDGIVEEARLAAEKLLDERRNNVIEP